ncbi:uncharacterized protein LOC131215633, partial [Anopheles bellator]|uniref:uncharacterized protein LOC131215633 n=1 Tax=Anopheles bellator TaxID=139047 RepID=UPI002648B64F
MEMSELSVLQFPEEIVQPFTLSCVDNALTVCTKEHTLVLQLKYRHIAEEATMNYEMTRVKCSTERPTGRLLANEIALYGASNGEERKRIMLDQTLFPNTAKVYVGNVQSWLSPRGTFTDIPDEQLLANLTNMGQLTVYRQDAVWPLNWNVHANVSECWLQYIYDNRNLETFEELRRMADEVLITCFCWADQVHRHPVQFCFGTRRGKIVLCHLFPGSDQQIVHVHQAEETAVLLKHVTVSTEECLLVAGMQSGQIGLYHFRSAQQTVGFKRIAKLFEQDLPASAIEFEVDHAKRLLLLLVVKGTHLLAIQTTFDGRVVASTTLDLENFMITGLQQLEERQYVVCTMPGAKFLVIVSASNLAMQKMEIKHDLNVDSYALYGLAATRTRSCWMVLGYPSKRFDHLTLRFPTSLFFVKFKERNAMNALLMNNSRQLAEYYDAAEVVRFDTHRNQESLNKMEQYLTETEVPNQTDPYLLKLQLVLLGAKIAYNKKRNMIVTEILHNQFQYICTILEVIGACRVLNYLSELASENLEPLNTLQQMSIRCLRRFIRTILDDTFPGDYEYLHTNVKPQLQSVLQRTDRVYTADVVEETCSFCDAPIVQSKGTCHDEHPVFRCQVTKLQIPIDAVEVNCRMCQ